MKIISGGQTGVDTAALEFAHEFGFAYGGWVPQGRKREGGTVDPKFDRLIENDNDDYSDRTRLNVGLPAVAQLRARGA